MPSIVICRAAADSAHTIIDLHPVLIVTSIPTPFIHMPISASFPTSSSAPTSKNVYLQQIHVLNVCQSPRPSNPELGRCISETRFCYLGRVRFDDSIRSHFQPPVWRKRVHMNLRVPKCRRGEGKARTQYPFYPLDASRCNQRLPNFFFILSSLFSLTVSLSGYVCLSQTRLTRGVPAIAGLSVS